MYKILDSTQSLLGPLGYIEGFIQLILELYESNRPTNTIGIDKVYIKCDCINASVVNGTREPILYSLALDKTSGHKLYKKLESNFLKR